MAPKVKFTKAQIVDAAFEIARAEGIAAVTIRKVAERLGSSIAPIYVNFKDAGELTREVVNRTFATSKRLLQEQHTGHPFHDIGVASLRFAREYSVLYRDLVMRKNDYMGGEQEDAGMLVDMMKRDSQLQDFEEAELMDILLKMKVFQTGLSVMTANELLPIGFDEAKTIALLDATAEDIIAATRRRKSGGAQ